MNIEKSERHSRAGKLAVAGHFKKKHGYAHPGSKAYQTWFSMLARCNRESHKSFPRYGGRGIRVCEEWTDFESFLKDMGDRPDGFSIGRIDNNKGYFKENCRWETMKEQQNNRVSNRVICAFGITKTLTQWADEFGIKSCTISRRIDVYGWDLESAIKTPVGARTRWTSEKRKVPGKTYHKYFGVAPADWAL
jgi:hypothetical protein